MSNGAEPKTEGFQITLPWRVVGVVLSLVLMGVVGGLGGDTLSYLRYGESRRPNAFTRNDGAKIEQRGEEGRAFLSQRIDKIERAHGLIEQRLDSIEKIDERLDRRMDNLPPDRWKIRIESLEWWVHTKDPEYRVPR